MGTTLTAVVAAGGRQLLIGHVGDSRAYLVHDGDLRRLTDDHSLVEELVREGRLTPEQAESHPQRAIVTRALGVDTESTSTCTPSMSTAGDRLIVVLRRAHDDGARPRRRAHRCAANPTRNTRPTRSSPPPTPRAARTTSPSSSIDVLEVDAVGRRRARDALDVLRATSPHATPREIAPMPPAPDVVPRAVTRGASLRGDRSSSSSRCSSCSASRPARSVGTRGARTTWAPREREVVIYKGVPGGVLGWDPTVDQRTGIAVADLAQIDRDRVRANTARGSLATAQAFVARLQATPITTHDDDHDDEPATPSPTTATATRPTTTTTVRDDDPSARSRARAGGPSSRSACSWSIVTVGGYVLVALADGPEAPARPLRAARVGVRPLPRRAPRGPPLRAERGRDAAPARRDAERHRLRHDRPARSTEDYARSACSRCGSRSASRVFVLTLFLVRDVRDLRALPLHRARCSGSASCCSRSRPASAARSTAAGCGSRSGRSRSNRARSRRCCSSRSSRRTSSTSASCCRTAGSASDAGSCRRCATSARCCSRGASRCSCSPTSKDVGTRCCSSACSRRCST